jgi:hypothetical protein
MVLFPLGDIVSLLMSWTIVDVGWGMQCSPMNRYILLELLVTRK